MSSLYQNMLIGDIVKAFEEMTLKSGNIETNPKNGEKTIVIKFEAKLEEEAI